MRSHQSPPVAKYSLQKQNVSCYNLYILYGSNLSLVIRTTPPFTFKRKQENCSQRYIFIFTENTISLYFQFFLFTHFDMKTFSLFLMTRKRLLENDFFSISLSLSSNICLLSVSIYLQHHINTEEIFLLLMSTRSRVCKIPTTYKPFHRSCYRS